MPIRFIPNDPRAGKPPNVVINPHADRPAKRAGFILQGSFDEDEHAIDTDAFLFWQCREAALRSIDLWEQITGQPLTTWQPGPQLRLKHRTPGEAQLNAFYDRNSLSFFQVDAPNGDSFRSGASTDVVAHEAGHAFLDSIRPDLWGSFFGEPGAFHEAFGDCIAILVALQDPVTREELVSKKLLRKKNFVASTAEDLSHGIATLIDPNHNAAAPRTALNKHQWAMPASLPISGGPGELINEVHSLGMIFSGCFYDTLTNIYDASGSATEAGLAKAAETAGRLLVAGAREAPLKSRFFQSVGNAMLIADQAQNGGAHSDAIREGFSAHNVLLNVQQMTSPTVVLAGRAPAARVHAVSDVITRASRRSLLEAVGEAPDQRLFAAQYELGGESVAAVRRRQKVALGDVAEDLEGVFCMVEEDVLIGARNGNAALLGAVETVQQSVAEVQNFVYSLHSAGQIGNDGETMVPTSHSVSGAGDDKRLVRKRFTCGCCRQPAPLAGWSCA